MKRLLLLLYFALLNISSAQDYQLVEQYEIGQSCKYYKYLGEGPVKIDLVEVDLTDNNIRIETAIANELLNKGLERTSELVKRKMAGGEYVLAAVNGDFFGDKPLQAQNSMVIKGEYAKGVRKQRGMFGISKENIPFIGELQFHGFLVSGKDTIEIDALNSNSKDYLNVAYNYFWDGVFSIDNEHAFVIVLPKSEVKPNTWIKGEIKGFLTEYNKMFAADNFLIYSIEKDKLPLLRKENSKEVELFLGTKTFIKDIHTIIGGLPTLAKNGKRPESFLGKEGLSGEGFIAKNPRTVIGYNREKTKFYMAAIDGRQKDISIGMTLYELADFMLSKGCYDVLNLDGGGSTILTIRDSIVNSPSDKTGERSVGNSLIITYSDKTNNCVKNFSFDEEEVATDSKGRAEIKYHALDKWGYPITLSKDKIKWSFEGISGENISGNIWKFSNGKKGMIIGEVNSIRDTVYVNTQSN